MQKFFWKLFPPFEVKLTRREIQAFIENHQNLATDIILNEALRLANETERTLYSIRIDHQKPDQLALIIVLNVIAKQIQDHCYCLFTPQWQLDVIGQHMLQFWRVTVSTLKERGYYTDAEVEEDMKWIQDKIQHAI